jgi:hypothetical protein
LSEELPKRTDAVSPARPKAVRLARSFAPEFEQLEAEEGADSLTLRHTSEEGVLPMITLGVTTGAFVMFVVIGLPMLQVTGPASLLWLVIGFAVLALVGVAMQVRVRTTQVRLDVVGITIDQGTPIDREHASIVWEEIASVALEPVDPKDERKGMQLRIVPRAGEPIDTLRDVAVGDLSEARRILLDRRNARRTAAKVRSE